MRLLLITAVALIAFAANSVFARLALADGLMDPASYSAIRLVSGAVTLSVLVLASRRSASALLSSGGSWLSGLALFGYAAAFSFAYLDLQTGTGAVILFASVQAALLGWAAFKGDRLGLAEWGGLLVAFAAFVWLVSPGIGAPSATGTVLMMISALCWAAYTLRGRGLPDPLGATAENFIRSIPAVVVLVVPFAARLEAGWFGVSMAVLSGAIASGMGYAVWYNALRELTAVQAAIVQPVVPVIAAAAGVLFVGDVLTLRLAVCSCFILGGVGLATLARTRRQAVGRTTA